jgi:hypothetical protein
MQIKGIEVLHIIIHDALFNGVIKPGPENKTLQTKESPQRKFLGLNLLTCSTLLKFEGT